MTDQVEGIRRHIEAIKRVAFDLELAYLVRGNIADIGAPTNTMCAVSRARVSESIGVWIDVGVGEMGVDCILQRSGASVAWDDIAERMHMCVKRAILQYNAYLYENNLDLNEEVAYDMSLYDLIHGRRLLVRDPHTVVGRALIGLDTDAAAANASVANRNGGEGDESDEEVGGRDWDTNASDTLSVTQISIASSNGGGDAGGYDDGESTFGGWIV